MTDRYARLFLCSLPLSVALLLLEVAKKIDYEPLQKKRVDDERPAVFTAGEKNLVAHRKVEGQ